MFLGSLSKTKKISVTVVGTATDTSASEGDNRAIPVHVCYSATGFQGVEAPKFLQILHIYVVC